MSIKSALFLLLLLPLITSLCTASGNAVSAYDVLEEYGFPIGLLPNGVLGYTLNSTTGAFKAYLNATCTFSIDSYKLKYNPTVSGYISDDKLSSLSGIYVKYWWFWLTIVKVTLNDDDELVFSVGIASAKFPAGNFDECPTCGCGFDCDGIAHKMKKKGMVLKMRAEGLLGQRL